jgi:hypothetical protein
MNTSRTKRLITAFILLGVGLSAMYMLPKTYGVRDSAIVMNLPGIVGRWYGENLQVSELEVKSLADDTDHEKKQYVRNSPDRPGQKDLLNAFIVLSGDDMNNSIHRPERCLPAQGYVLESVGERQIDLGDGNVLKVMRLRSHHGKAISPSGSPLPNLTYYWFVGAAETTNGHYSRTFIDMRDRLFKGQNQRWAYVTIAANFNIDWSLEIANRTEEEADKMIEDFIKEIFPSIHKEELL